MLPLLAFAMGLATGMRSMSGLAAITWAANYGWLHLAGLPLAFFALPAVRWIVTLCAIGEWIADKLPFIPSRKAPVPMIGRFIAGAACGLALGLGATPLLPYFHGQESIERLDMPILAACVTTGILGAAAGTFGGYEFRRRLVQATGGRDLPIALLEDAIVVALLASSLFLLAHRAPVQTNLFYDVL